MKNGEQKDLGCDGNGKRVILVKVKKFREPAKMFIQCGGCAKCESHLTKRAADVCHESPSKTHSWYGSSQGYVCEHCGTRR